MGTFTKSFGSIGGYIAADQSVIDYLRCHSSIALHCDTLAPPCAQQILSVLEVLEGQDGTDLGMKRIAQLKENSRFLRDGLEKLGFIILGDNTSPVVPVMCYNSGKMLSLSRKCLERGLAIVVVGYPATSLLENRIRFCVSAAHTREDLQFTLDVLEELCSEVYLQYNHKRRFPFLL
uniref:serine C-palmitoyltransferase n=1 Tax=Lygus hesperus TaxID=30085 RepID=A0A0A9WV63_LYGHE